MAKRRV